MSELFSENDAFFMRRALALAARGRGRVEPNPMVGAVLVALAVGPSRKAGTPGGKIVGEGFHQRFGHAHAEINALAAAGTKARGATLYVTLEPCCHWGKTPPCTDAILAAGIRRVVIAMIDPFAKVRGRGAAILRNAGLSVSIGLLENQARALNAPFLTRIQKHRPFIIAKWAQSLDGRIARPPGDSRWISSEISRAWVHRLRARMDGVLVGIGTALADDPLLTARLPAPNGERRPPRIATRIILDSQCRLPPNSRLVRTAADAPVLVVHHARLGKSAENRRRVLAARGVMMLGVPKAARGGCALPPLLAHLADLEYTNLLVEGGSGVLSTFFDQALVDEAHVFVAPFLIGTSRAPGVLAVSAMRPLTPGPHLVLDALERSGPDAHLTLRRQDSR